MRRQTGRPNEYPKSLAEIAVEVTQLMEQRGSDAHTAMEIAFEVTEMIRQRFGGNQLYIPRASQFFISKRNEEMLNAFNGRNMQELCAEYGMTTRRFYQILQAANTRKRIFEQIGPNQTEN